MYKLLFGAVGVALLVTGVGWFSYSAGVNSEIAAGAKIIAEYQDKQREMVEELEQEKKKRKIKYRDKIKVITKVVDVCADTDAPDLILQQFKASGTP